MTAAIQQATGSCMFLHIYLESFNLKPIIKYKAIGGFTPKLTKNSKIKK